MKQVFNHQGRSTPHTEATNKYTRPQKEKLFLSRTPRGHNRSIVHFALQWLDLVGDQVKISSLSLSPPFPTFFSFLLSSKKKTFGRRSEGQPSHLRRLGFSAPPPTRGKRDEIFCFFSFCLTWGYKMGEWDKETKQDVATPTTQLICIVFCLKDVGRHKFFFFYLHSERWRPN